MSIENAVEAVARLLYQRDAAVFAVTRGVAQPEWDDLSGTDLGRYMLEASYIVEKTKEALDAET